MKNKYFCGRKKERRQGGVLAFAGAGCWRWKQFLKGRRRARTRQDRMQWLFTQEHKQT